jgi:hypothetical protein
VSSGGITGTPTTAGVYDFTLHVTDQTGTRDTEAFRITVEAPRPRVITTPSAVASHGDWHALRTRQPTPYRGSGTTSVEGELWTWKDPARASIAQGTTASPGSTGAGA